MLVIYHVFLIKSIKELAKSKFFLYNKIDVYIKHQEINFVFR